MPKIWTYSDPTQRGYGLFKRKLLHEFNTAGWETRIAEAPLLEPESKPLLRQDLLDAQPDWILLINQSAGQLYDYLHIADPLRPLSSRKLVWYLDDPRYFVDQPFEANEHVFCFDETYLGWLKTRCSTPPGFLPLAADQEKAGKVKPEYGCEIAFVGGVIDQSARRAQLSPPMQHYVQQLVDAKLQHRSASFDELALKHPIAEGKQIHITADVAHYLYWEANNAYRIHTLEALRDYDLRIYGNEDWEILLQGSPLLAHYRGKADPNSELPDIFASSKINLNIHSIQCMGSLNQRDFNAPICGGFLLSDWVPAAGRYFQPGIEAVFYSDVVNLRRKVDYYLNHPAERQAVIEHGKIRIQNDHTYTQRFHALLKQLSA